MDQQNVYKKKIGTNKTLTREYFGPTKYSRENILDPRNIYENKFGRRKYPRRHDDTMELDRRDPRWHATQEIKHTQNKLCLKRDEDRFLKNGD